MSEEAYVVSDLHVGSGESDPLDDFLDDELFAEFVRAHARSDVTLVINGDFVDFAQIEPLDVSTVPADRLWDEDVSVQKLESAVRGHPTCFAALGDFLSRGGHLTVIIGNHDFDLAWRRVQQRLRDHWAVHADQVDFVVGAASYHGVHIEHGYQFSPENCPANPAAFIHHWDHGGKSRELLERVWGTDFLLRFFNDLERRHPYIDNVKPTVWVAWQGLKKGWIPKSELVHLAVFLKRRMPWRPIASLMDIGNAGGAVLAQSFAESEWQQLVVDALNAAPGDIEEAISALPPDDKAVLARPVTVSIGEELALDERGETMRLFRADSREQAWARKRLAEPGVTHVVFGHTHQIVDGNGSDTTIPSLFNPGSWIPHLDLRDPAIAEKIKVHGVTLELLDDISLYQMDPYAVRIRPGQTRSWVELMRCS